MDDLAARLAALETRTAALERAAGSAPGAAGVSSPDQGLAGPGLGGQGLAGPGLRDEGFDEKFWALRGLKDRLDRSAVANDGGVLFAGSVDLPDGHVEWQIGADTGDLVESDWTDHAETLAALGHPVRLRLLQAIATGTRTSAELQELPGLGTTGQIYHHLRALTGAGWLRAGVRGRWSVPPERLVPLLVVMAAARR